jgi:Outer membrane protein beta-barrel domain
MRDHLSTWTWNQWVWKIVVCGGLGIASTGVAAAQAKATADYGTEIVPFAMATEVHTDWGPNGRPGFSAGVDATRVLSNSAIQPSLELRMTQGSNAAVTENSYVGGARIAAGFSHVRPYAAVLAGYGTIDFLHPTINAKGQLYKSDDSIVYSMGGGAEVDFMSAWKVRVEFMQQFWHLPLPLTPSAVSVGVSYRIPFHNRGGIR